MKISQLHIHLYAPEPTAKLTPEERLDVYDRVIERLKAARKIAYQTEATVDRICDKLEIPKLEVEGDEGFSNQVEDLGEVKATRTISRAEDGSETRVDLIQGGFAGTRWSKPYTVSTEDNAATN